MNYKSKQYVTFNDRFCEPLSINAIISEEDYQKIPDEYKDSWKPEVAKPTHIIALTDNCIYMCLEIPKKDSRYNDIKNWFAKKI